MSKNGNGASLRDLAGVLILVLITIVGLFLLIQKKTDSHLNAFLLLSLGSLSLALGLERTSIFGAWIQKLDSIDASLDRVSDSVLDNMPWAWFVRGTDQVYRTASELVTQAEVKIRAFSIEQSARTDRSFEKTIAQHLRSREHGVTFKAIYPCDLSSKEKISDLWRDGIERLTLHEVQGTIEDVSLSFVQEENPIGFSILLIDNKHALIAIPAEGDGTKKTFFKRLFQKNKGNYKGAILLRSQPTAVGRLVDWFDGVLDQEGLETLEFEGLQDRAVKAAATQGAEDEQARILKRTKWLAYCKACLELAFSKLSKIQALTTSGTDLRGVTTFLFYLQAVIGLFFGAVGLIAEMLEWFGHQYTQGTILTGLLCLLALTIALERIVSFPNWSRRLVKIQQKVGYYNESINSQLKGFRFLEGEEDITSKGAELLERARAQIKAVSFGSNAQAPKSFQESLKKRLGSVTGLDLNFTSAIATIEKDHEGVVKVLKRRLYEINDSRVRFYTFPQSSLFALDLLVVDSQDAMIGIRSNRTNKYSGALYFPNQPDLSAHLADWLGSFVLSVGEPVDLHRKEGVDSQAETNPVPFLFRAEAS